MKLGEFLVDLGRTNAYFPSLTKVTGSVKATLFLSQLCYWEGKQSPNSNRWIYKTAADMEDETGLTRREQESARKSLKKLGVLEEMYARTPRTLHFRVNFDVLEDKWQEYLNEKKVVEVDPVEEIDVNSEQKETDLAMHQNATLTTQFEPMHQNANLHSTKTHIYIRQKRTSNTETTADTTQEIIVDESLRSSSPTREVELGSLERASKHKIVGKKEVADISTVVAEASSKAVESRKRKEQKPKRTIENAVTATRYFANLFEETFQGKAPLELAKDRALLKKMIEHQGYAETILMMDWLFRNWAMFRRECKVTGVPTVGMFFGFRGYLQDKVRNVSVVSKDVPDNPWGV